MAIKQKMEVKVQGECKNARQIAMKVASQTDGVENVGVEGDKLVITGTEIYWVKLLKLLEKKLGCIQLLTLAEVKPPKKEEPKKEEPKKKEDPKPAPPCPYPPAVCFVVDPLYQSPCSDPCSIM